MGIARSWERLAETAAEEQERAAKELIEAWDEKLRDLGGDFSRLDWRNFRLLSLTREEEWSDWLAFLLLDPTSGGLAGELFGVEGLRCRDARREVRIGGGERRIDIILEWEDQTASTIEVKVRA